MDVQEACAPDVDEGDVILTGEAFRSLVARSAELDSAKQRQAEAEAWAHEAVLQRDLARSTLDEFVLQSQRAEGLIAADNWCEIAERRLHKIGALSAALQALGRHVYWHTSGAAWGRIAETVERASSALEACGYCGDFQLLRVAPQSASHPASDTREGVQEACEASDEPAEPKDEPA